MKTVLLTGATGFVGSRLLPRLVAAGYSVVAIARHEQPAVPGVQWVIGDLHTCGKLTIPDGVSVLVDLAASIPSPGVPDDELQFYRNTQGRIELAARLHQLAHIVYVSTIDVYGPPQSAAFREEDTAKPLTFYAAGKLAVEHMYAVFSGRSAVCLTTLRFSQVYGRGDTGSKIIPLFTRAIREDNEIVLTNNGAALRKYLHLEDACSSILRAIHAEKAGTYNIAGPTISSIKETLHCIESALGKGARIRAIQGPAADLIMDTSRAARELGFNAVVTLADGIAREI